MLYLTCTMISSVDLARYGVSGAKDRVSGDCGTILLVEGLSGNIIIDLSAIELSTLRVNLRVASSIPLRSVIILPL